MPLIILADTQGTMHKIGKKSKINNKNNNLNMYK